MNYSAIKKCDIANGTGVRVVLFVSGCNHHCKGCHNKITWDPNSGLQFDDDTKQEIFEQLDKEYISGITFSGGDPLHENNKKEISNLILEIKSKYSDKNIWLYTGYTIEELIDINDNDINTILYNIDVLVDGRFIEELKDITYKWAGSTNQRILNKEHIREIIKTRA